MTTYLEDETGTETSQPREGIEITTGTLAWRVTSGSRTVTINGVLYTPATCQRGTVAVATSASANDHEFRLPVSHEFTQRYLSASPPRQVVVRIWRKQVTSGEVKRLWEGLITKCRVDGHVATFSVPSRLGLLLPRRLPVVTAGRSCGHILYDGNCRVSRASFVVATTISAINGNEVTVSSDGGNPDQWAQFGEMLHVASGERMTISSHVGNVLSLQLSMHGIAVGDAVQVFAGCDHTIATCRDKFNNVVNYGGIPELPTRNPFLTQNGFGVYESEPT